MKRSKSTYITREAKSNGDKIVFYTDKRGDIELRADVEKDTIWATQEQIAGLFETSKQLVSWHIKNIFREGELTGESTVKESLTVVGNGRKYIVRYFNLDVIIAVGYRVNSKKATKFRIWATKILREYLVRGFNMNERRLERVPETLDGLHEAVSLLESKRHKGKLKGKIILRVSKELSS